MGDLTFYDAAGPIADAPSTDGVAFYIGGDCFHVWSRSEIEATRNRYRLPIFVRSHPLGTAQAGADALDALRVLHDIGAPRGCLVAWDTETAADPAYMSVVYRLITAAGYKLIDYGSQSALFANEMPVGGYYWGADWTGNAHIDQGDAGTQYVDAGKYDLSVFKPGLPFWDTRPGGTPPPVTNQPTWQENIMQQLPVVKVGETGEVVRTIQGLCTARGWATKVDGDFGSQTASSVHLVQAHAGLNADGVVGPATWPVLLGVA